MPTAEWLTGQVGMEVEMGIRIWMGEISMETEMESESEGWRRREGTVWPRTWERPGGTHDAALVVCVAWVGAAEVRHNNSNNTPYNNIRY